MKNATCPGSVSPSSCTWYRSVRTQTLFAQSGCTSDECPHARIGLAGDETMVVTGLDVKGALHENSPFEARLYIRA